MSHTIKRTQYVVCRCDSCGKEAKSKSDEWTDFWYPDDWCSVNIRVHMRNDSYPHGSATLCGECVARVVKALDTRKKWPYPKERP